MQYDAIVIGAGNGGLVAAARLSQLGFKVLSGRAERRPRRMRQQLQAGALRI